MALRWSAFPFNALNYKHAAPTEQVLLRRTLFYVVKSLH